MHFWVGPWRFKKFNIYQGAVDEKACTWLSGACTVCWRLIKLNSICLLLNYAASSRLVTWVSASLGPTREDRALIPGTEAMPADVLIPNWCSGKDAAMDVTVVNPLQTRMVDQAATHAGHSLTVRFNDKMNKHGEACMAWHGVHPPGGGDTGGLGRSAWSPDQEVGGCSC